MNSHRQLRIAVLTTAARRRSIDKTKAAEDAIRSLIKRGEPITFQAVQRQAGVSHSFLYSHPDLRGCIERLRAQNRSASSPPPTRGEDTIAHALAAEVTRLKRQHRQEISELQAALEQAHGENLELRRELARRGGAGGAQT
ncbi:DUF6262 family protein [Nonomuraea sp. NPDC000554]|uniref:DUF6262 family protein n=1 Tax=Nonomuraea sp. NPDC000554 TaxID=3154259 RepID=UPI00331DB106